MEKRTSPHKKALQIIKYFRHEDPDYNYIRAVLGFTAYPAQTGNKN
jgi:hypothetical protein